MLMGGLLTAILLAAGLSGGLAVLASTLVVGGAALVGWAGASEEFKVIVVQLAKRETTPVKCECLVVGKLCPDAYDKISDWCKACQG